MLKSDYDGQVCSVARTLEAVGERWTLLIVRELMYRPRRFSGLESRLGVAKNVLSNRLGKLVALGIVDTRRLEGGRDWNVYGLTERGRDLFPVIAAMMAWGDRHAAPGGPPVLFEHACGHAAGHALVCRACGEAADAHSVTPITGPGWTAGAAPHPFLDAGEVADRRQPLAG